MAEIFDVGESNASERTMEGVEAVVGGGIEI